MAYSYMRLWILLTQKKMSKEELRVGAHLSSATIARMGRDENVSLEVLDKICGFLNCRLEDVVERVASNNNDI